MLKNTQLQCLNTAITFLWFTQLYDSCWENYLIRCMSLLFLNKKYIIEIFTFNMERNISYLKYRSGI